MAASFAVLVSVAGAVGGARASDDAPAPAEWLPGESLLAPLFADPREPRLALAAIALRSEGDASTSGSVAAGHTLGLLRWSTRRVPAVWEIGVSGAVQSLFRLDAPSNELVNVDYLVAGTLAARWGARSLRLRLLHSSSHLGDELILSGSAPERTNLSLAVLDAVVSWRLRGVALYAGGGWAVRHEPEDLDAGSALAGVQGLSRPLGRHARVVAGLQLDAIQERGWRPAATARGGVALSRDATAGGTAVLFVLEAHHGFLPFGQFFASDGSWIGVGVQIDP